MLKNFFKDKVISTDGDSFGLEQIIDMFEKARCSDLGALFSFFMKKAARVLASEMPQPNDWDKRNGNPHPYNFWSAENLKKYDTLLKNARGIENIGVTGDLFGKDGFEFKLIKGQFNQTELVIWGCVCDKHGRRPPTQAHQAAQGVA